MVICNYNQAMCMKKPFVFHAFGFLSPRVYTAIKPATKPCYYENVFVLTNSLDFHITNTTKCDITGKRCPKPAKQGDFDILNKRH